MKGIFVGLLLAFILVKSTPALAGTDFTVSETSITDASGTPSISGIVPQVTGLSDALFQGQLNAAIQNIYNDKLAQAEKGERQEISFSYDTKRDGDVVSLLLYITVLNASEAEEVVSVNFDPVTCEMVTLTDVLGENAVAVVDRLVLDTMRQQPDVYSGDFKGTSPTSSFYVDNGNCVMLFDKYAIAAGYMRIVEIPIKISDLMSCSVAKDEYVVLEDYYNLKMIPLRSVCEGLGYTVGWDRASGSITVTRAGFITRLEPGKNAYRTGNFPPKELESDPLVKDGVTYVPISFYEAILGAAYSIDDDENITFSQYHKGSNN